MSVSITIDLPKTNYFGGERVDGNLTIRTSSAVKIPGVVINAGSRTVLTQGADGDDTNHSSNARIVEPYKQQLRVAMPRSGEKDISLSANSTTNYPFALILPPDLFPSYYCVSTDPEDGTCYVASLAYHLTGGLATECDVTVEAESKEVQIVPVALPYGPQPRKGYVIPVFDNLNAGEDSEDEEVQVEPSPAAAPPSEHGDGSQNGASTTPTSNDNDNDNDNEDESEGGEQASSEPAETKKEKSKAGCFGGSSSKKKGAATSKKRGAASQATGVTSKADKSKKASGVVHAGMVKVGLTMQTAYICLPPNDGPVRADKSSGGANTLWVEVRLSNQMKKENLPFQMRLTLKMVTTYKPPNGEPPVANVFVLASRTAKAIVPSRGSQDVLELRPGESTPMRLSLTVPQQLALSKCDPIPIVRYDGTRATRQPVPGPVPPTVESSTFDARTILEVTFTPLEGKTKNEDHVILLEDPVEIVGVPSGE